MFPPSRSPLTLTCFLVPALVLAGRAWVPGPPQSAALRSGSFAAWAQTAPGTPPAKPADVATPDAIIDAVYASISGPAGQPRDWARFRSLLIPGARLIPSARRTPGTTTPVVWSAEEYIAAAGPGLDRQGFFEREIHRTTEAFGAVLHAFSTYDSKRTPDGEPFARGINSFQLYSDGTRWWIVTIFWDAETSDKSIPAKYLSR